MVTGTLWQLLASLSGGGLGVILAAVIGYRFGQRHPRKRGRHERGVP